MTEGSPMGRLVSLSGPSGSGKSTLARLLCERLPGARMVPSYTTRAHRESDTLTGEYRYVFGCIFRDMELRREFIWAVGHDSQRYGTRRADIDEVLAASDVTGIQILTPGAVGMLRGYLAQKEALDAHLPIFIAPSGEAVLKRRLLARGDTPEQIAKRFAQESDWYLDALDSGIPYAFIHNDGDIEDAYRKIRFGLLD